MKKHCLEALGVMRRDAPADSALCPDDTRDLRLPSEHISVVADIVDELVGGDC